MVIIVQLFPSDENSPRDNIAAGIFGFEIAITPEMAYPVDHASGHDWSPGHLYGPDRKSDGTKQDEVDDQHQRDPFGTMPGVDISLHPVIRSTASISLQSFHILGFFPVELGSFS